MAKPHFSDRTKEQLIEAGRLLREAETPIRILKSIAWPATVAAEFYAAKASRLPQPVYTPFDSSPSLAAIARARSLLDGDGVVHQWLNRTADQLERAAHMLAAVGTAAFHDRSVEIYGTPDTDILDGKTSSLQLANAIDNILAAYGHADLTQDEPQAMGADELKSWLQVRIGDFFGNDAPAVEITENLPCKAVAGSRRIRVRRGSMFSDLDAAQLLQHEAFIHITTSINGRAQRHFPILGAGHVGTTRTQEGLAVLSEIMTGAIDPPRMRRLAQRTVDIKRSIDGADFMDLYRANLERTDDPVDSFENARRIVRGGLVTGRAPFTKDGVYLDGLLRVHNYLRVAVASGDADNLRILFTGKLDIEDVPALLLLRDNGLIDPPRYLPPWTADLRFLVTYMAYSSFLNRVDLGTVRDHYAKFFQINAHAAEGQGGTPE